MKKYSSFKQILVDLSRYALCDITEELMLSNFNEFLTKENLPEIIHRIPAQFHSKYNFKEHITKENLPQIINRLPIKGQENFYKTFSIFPQLIKTTDDLISYVYSLESSNRQLALIEYAQINNNSLAADSETVYSLICASPSLKFDLATQKIKVGYDQIKMKDKIISLAPQKFGTILRIFEAEAQSQILSAFTQDAELLFKADPAYFPELHQQLGHTSKISLLEQFIISQWDFYFNHDMASLIHFLCVNKKCNLTYINSIFSHFSPDQQLLIIQNIESVYQSMVFVEGASNFFSEIRKFGFGFFYYAHKLVEYLYEECLTSCFPARFFDNNSLCVLTLLAPITASILAFVGTSVAVWIAVAACAYALALIPSLSIGIPAAIIELVCEYQKDSLECFGNFEAISNAKTKLSPYKEALGATFFAINTGKDLTACMDSTNTATILRK